MKQQRIRFRLITVVILCLLLAAALYGIYSVNTYGNRWVSPNRNYRYRSQKSRVTAGDILDRNGVMLASTDENGDRVYQQDLLSRAALVHLLGDTEGYVSNAVESFQANALLGMNASVKDRFEALISGKQLKGETVSLTIDSRLSTYIAEKWRSSSSTRNNCGAVIVMNYRTGEVLSMVSFPIYDPLNVTDEVKSSKLHPFWNRCTQATMPPGSTFKMITTAAALQYMKDAEERVFNCTGALPVLDRTVTDYGDEVHGEITMEKAFRLSCNNTFAQIALEIGDTALRKTAESFGFNDNFLFRDLVVENSIYPTTDRNEYSIAWSGVGQSRVAVTPMHMCMVAASIANNGIMMEPRIVSKIESPSGTVRESFTPREYRRVCDEIIAKTLQGYMKNVVKNGTGTRAQVSGLTIAGKTGSAEGNNDGKAVTHAWFAGYCENARYPYAICVLVEEGGSGGSVAAPVAQAVFSYLAEHY